jgi:hypothetical protein
MTHMKTKAKQMMWIKKNMDELKADEVYKLYRKLEKRKGM